MEFIWFSWKKSHMSQMGHFGLKIACCHNSGSTLMIFLKFCIIEVGKSYMKISFSGFCQKKYILGKWAFLCPKMVCLHSSGSTLIISFCNLEEWKGSKGTWNLKLMVLQRKTKTKKPVWGKWPILDPDL